MNNNLANHISHKHFSSFVTVLIIMALMWGLSACAMQEAPEPLEADQINIFYGVSSWAMFGADPESVQQLVDMYNVLELQQTDEELDFTTTFRIAFIKDEEPIGSWLVDENGRCQLAGDDTPYKIVFESFDYEAIRDIYENSKSSPDYMDGIYQGGKSDVVDVLISNVLQTDWPQGIVALIGQMSDSQKQAFIAAPVEDGTVEFIARQLVAKWIADFDGAPAYTKTDGKWQPTGDVITIADAEISDIDLVASFDEQSATPLYLYEPIFRILPADGAETIPAGSLGMDDAGWIVDSNSAGHRMLLEPAGGDSYHYLGTPAFDIQPNLAIRELIVDEPEEAGDFILSGDFIFILGRQFGAYPWGDYNFDIPEPQIIEQSDMPGMDFYRATFGPRTGKSDGEGETEIIYYTVEESGYTVISSMNTTDPKVSTGIYRDRPRIQPGDSEAELFAAYPGELTENLNMVYGPYDFCCYDQVYEYAPVSFYGRQTIRFYLNQGAIQGIEMFITLD